MSILKTILLSSLATLMSDNPDAKSNYISISKDDINNDILLPFKHKNDLSLKLRLNLSNSGEWSFDSHRSHRSHSSHRSHYSSNNGHYSHFSSATGTNKKETKKETNSLDEKEKVKKNQVPNSNESYSLGDRTLYKGMKGTDVTEMANILIKKGYLKFSDGTLLATGVYEYDNIIFNAVKEFQKNNGLKSDGVVGTSTVFYLKKK